MVGFGGVCIVLLIFKSDRIVVGMVFGGGGEGICGKGSVLAKKWAINKIVCCHSKTVLLVLGKKYLYVGWNNFQLKLLQQKLYKTDEVLIFTKVIDQNLL